MGLEGQMVVCRRPNPLKSGILGIPGTPRMPIDDADQALEGGSVMGDTRGVVSGREPVGEF